MKTIFTFVALLSTLLSFNALASAVSDSQVQTNNIESVKQVEMIRVVYIQNGVNHVLMLASDQTVLTSTGVLIPAKKLIPQRHKLVDSSGNVVEIISVELVRTSEL